MCECDCCNVHSSAALRSPFISYIYHSSNHCILVRKCFLVYWEIMSFIYLFFYIYQYFMIWTYFINYIMYTLYYLCNIIMICLFVCLFLVQQTLQLRCRALLLCLAITKFEPGIHEWSQWIKIAILQLSWSQLPLPVLHYSMRKIISICEEQLNCPHVPIIILYYGYIHTPSYTSILMYYTQHIHMQCMYMN